MPAFIFPSALFLRSDQISAKDRKQSFSPISLQANFRATFLSREARRHTRRFFHGNQLVWQHEPCGTPHSTFYVTQLLSEKSPLLRQELRLAIPSKGRMAEDTIDFLKDCGLSVKRNNPRQYSAVIADMEPQIEVWFQRATDIVRKVMDGDVDFGLVGYDLVAEESNGSPDVVVVHDALGFGHCRLSVAVPTSWQDVHSMDDLVRFAKSRPESSPLRAVSKYHNMTRKFFESCGMHPYKLLYGDGALEANPPMGSADFIVDLVSTGVTLRENQLKEIEGGTMLKSQSVLIANRSALASRPDALAAAHEMLERFEAHLYAKQKYEVTANMRGESEQDVGSQLLSQPDLGGLSGPTVSRIILKDGTETDKWFSVSVVVGKDRLYESMREMRRIGGRGILVKPITYIFEDDPPRWSALLDTLATSS